MNALNVDSKRAIEWIAGELLTDAFREALREEVRAAVADAHADEAAADDSEAATGGDSSGGGVGRTLGKLALVGAGVAVAAYLVRSRTGATEDLLGDGEVGTGTGGTVDGAGQWGDDGSDRGVGGPDVTAADGPDGGTAADGPDGGPDGGTAADGPDGGTGDDEIDV